MDLRFYTGIANLEADTPQVMIDQSGHLLVGRTSVGATGNGHSIRGGDSAIFSRDASGETMQICRNASDGEIIRFKSNDSTVGSIGTANSGDLYIGNDDTGLLFAGGSDMIIPRGTDGATRDAAIDLGATSHRFKNLHLSGSVQLYGSGEGIVFGSTASAAHTLDDYEEGTWTPTLLGSTSNPTVSYTTQSGYYTKIGNAVSLFCRLQTSAVSGGSGHARVGGLPFANHSTAKSGAAIGIVSGVDLTSGYTQYGFTGTASATTLDYVQSGDNLTASVINLSAIAASSNHDIFFTYTYTT
jgi:hypothetical protein